MRATCALMRYESEPSEPANQERQNRKVDSPAVVDAIRPIQIRMLKSKCALWCFEGFYVVHEYHVWSLERFEIRIECLRVLRLVPQLRGCHGSQIRHVIHWNRNTARFIWPTEPWWREESLRAIEAFW